MLRGEVATYKQAKRKTNARNHARNRKADAKQAQTRAERWNRGCSGVEDVSTRVEGLQGKSTNSPTADQGCRRGIGASHNKNVAKLTTLPSANCVCVCEAQFSSGDGYQRRGGREAEQ